MKFQKNSALILSLFSCFLLLIFLWWHWRLGMTRYFDADEFAHLSWAYQMLSGRRPYVDFLFYIPPGFQVFLMPLFLLGGGATPILAGRAFAFVVFVLLVGTTMFLFWLMRRSWVAILAGVFLAFLPIPFDKFLEIRPDTLAMVFALVGMVFQILAIKGLTFYAQKVKPYHFFAGILYGVSLLILPKTLPQVGVAIAVALFTKNIRPFFLGLLLPLLIFGLWALTLGNIDQVIYSIISLPLEAKKIGATFIMMPDLFFYPNTIFYGASGWSRGLIVNHAIWVTAILVGAYRLLVPFSAKKKEQVWSEFLIAATFFVHIIFYVSIVPLKHTQYLIPIAVFVAFYAADAVDMLWKKTIGVNPLAAAVFLTLFIIGSGGLWQTFVSVHAPKLAWTNTDTLKQLTTLYHTIPGSEYVLDLTGATIYYKHPYVACCNEFGQFVPYLSRPLPPLIKALVDTGTKYVYQGGLDRLSTLPPQDRQYITERYLPSPAIWGLFVKK